MKIVLLYAFFFKSMLTENSQNSQNPQPFPFGEDEDDRIFAHKLKSVAQTRSRVDRPFPEQLSSKRSSQDRVTPTEDLWANPKFDSENHWGFDTSRLSAEERQFIEAYKNRQISSETALLIKTTTLAPLQPDPYRRGLLKEVGDVNVGFGVGVGPYASVNTGVGVQLGGSGPAGALNEALGYDIFPRQGEQWVLDDYTGNKDNIVPDRWRQYWIAVSEGRIQPPPRYAPPKEVAGVKGNVGIGLPNYHYAFH
ncbi:unnamed protein product, partial [Mesorhabditis belari]|uniref:Uncharacterized protein n=1 Tax=Mesorhabditis belari TaxID=2138241 RepID=A0AAF3EWP0_9BILA